MYIYVCVFLHSAVVKGFQVQQIPAVTCLVTVGVVRHSTNLCGIWLYLTGVVVEINRRVFLSKGLSRLVGLRRHPTSRTRYAYSIWERITPGTKPTNKQNQCDGARTCRWISYNTYDTRMYDTWNIPSTPVTEHRCIIFTPLAGENASSCGTERSCCRCCCNMCTLRAVESTLITNAS